MNTRFPTLDEVAVTAWMLLAAAAALVLMLGYGLWKLVNRHCFHFDVLGVKTGHAPASFRFWFRNVLKV